MYFTQTSDNEWRSVSVQRHVKDASAPAYARSMELNCLHGQASRPRCKQDTYRGAWAWAWASAISASFPNRQGMECATHSIGIPVRYTSTVVRLLLRSRQRYRAWRITCQRLRALFALPNGCPPRSAMSIPCAPAADEAATWTTSRGASSSCMVKTGCALCLCDGHGCSSMAIASTYSMVCCWECMASRPLDRLLDE